MRLKVKLTVNSTSVQVVEGITLTLDAKNRYGCGVNICELFKSFKSSMVKFDLNKTKQQPSHDVVTSRV